MEFRSAFVSVDEGGDGDLVVDSGRCVRFRDEDNGSRRDHHRVRGRSLKCEGAYSGGSLTLEASEAEESDELLEFNPRLGVNVPGGGGNRCVEVGVRDYFGDRIDDLTLRRTNLGGDGGVGYLQVVSDVFRDLLRGSHFAPAFTVLI